MLVGSPFALVRSMTFSSTLWVDVVFWEHLPLKIYSWRKCYNCSAHLILQWYLELLFSLFEESSTLSNRFHHSQSHWFCSRLHLPAQSAVIVLLFSWIRPFRTLENDLPSSLPLMPSHHRSLAIFSNSRFLHHQPAKYQSVRQNE